MQGTARGRCFRFPHERPNEHSPYRTANDSCNARPAQGPKRMQGTARGRCFRFPHESPKRAFAISHGKRFVQREARPRAEADAGHRKRALLPLPARKPQRAFAILYYVSQDKRFVQHEPHLPAIGSTARLHTNELRPLFSFHIINSRQPGDDLLRAVCCFFRFTKLN